MTKLISTKVVSALTVALIFSNQRVAASEKADMSAIAASRQNAVIFKNVCGALPRRRYIVFSP
jgi:hypothetical protein